MKKCHKCGSAIADDNARFCLECGTECVATTTATADKSKDKDGEASSLIGDKNIISGSTIVGKQEKYEASNITINQTTIEDHSHTTVVCAVSGKRVYMDSSVVCPVCGKTVAKEYYADATRRCLKCEEEAEASFRNYATQLLAGSTFDANSKSLLEAKGKELMVDAAKQRNILREVQSATSRREISLSAVQQAELDAAVEKLIRVNSQDECIQALNMFKALHDMSQNYTVEFWYYLSRAIADSKSYVAEYEEELTDNYWQRYWGFLAYTILGDARSIAAIERLRKSYSDREDDVTLAEGIYFVARGFVSNDPKLVSNIKERRSKIRPEYLSKPLMFVYNTLVRLGEEGLRIDVEYSIEERFTIINILRGGNLLKAMFADKQAEEKRLAELAAAQQRAEREAREREEREREAAEARRRKEEAERKAKEEALRQQHKNRIEEEKARMDGKKPAAKREDKAFVGYQNDIPKKKSKLGRIALIVLLVLVALIGILFLIPAPESMQ